MRWSAQFLGEMRRVGDQPADLTLNRLVEAKGPDAVHSFFHNLISNIHLPVDLMPEVIQPFLQSEFSMPDWADFSKMDLAAEYFTDHGPECLLILYFKSLPLLYSCADGAQVLARTGRLAHDSTSNEVFARRIAETGQFLLDVMCIEAFDPGGPGLIAIQKVRLIHASIRQFVMASGWNPDNLGVPVHQLHQAGTLMTFSVALIDGLRQLGVIDSQEKEEAFIHRWNVIGSLLGISDQLLPDSINSARELLREMLAIESRQSEEGRLLTEALVSYGKEAIPRERLDVIPEILIRYLCGEEIASKLGVRITGGCLGFAIPTGLGKLFGLVEKLEDRDHRIRKVSEIASEVLLNFTVNSFNKQKEHQFRLPHSLSKAWKSKISS